MSSSEPYPATDPPLSRGQWLLLMLLAAVQFTHIVDFVIIMPLAPHLTRGLDIGTRQFGLVVSAYGWAAFLAGLFLARWVDRFDRKRTLLTLFAGFTLGTLLCAVAPDYAWLLAGRAIAGGFGGIVAANVLAIVGDAFPDRRRGQATGVVMSAFSVASIAGVPAGLLLAGSSTLGWRAPFVALTVLSVAILALGAVAIPSLRGHLLAADVKKVGLTEVLLRPDYLKAFAVMLTLVFGGFLVIPYIADFLSKNVGVSDGGIQLMYVFGGVATLATMNVVGKLADRFPRLALFRVLGLLALGPIYLLTWLPHGTPLALVLVVTTVMMMLMSGRMVPLTALTTGIAAPRERGAFMSVMGAIQQLGAGLAPVAASLLMGDTKAGQPLEGFSTAGLASVAVGVLALLLAGMLAPARSRRGPVTPVPAAVPGRASSAGSAGIAPAPGVRGRA